MYKAVFTCTVFALLFAACNPQKKLARQKQAYMEDTYVTVKDAVNEAQVSILNDTVKVLFPENLLFQLEKSAILPENEPLLERFASALNQLPRTSVLISGYTDNTGSAGYNEQLSHRRAQAAQSVLSRYGVHPARMYTWGRGSRNPIADNGTLEGRKRNRRVEFILLYDYRPSGD